MKADVDTGALQDWGTISVRLDSCLNGQFTYESNLSQFGSATFELDRLGYIESLGCQD